jgi:hypothetical protein
LATDRPTARHADCLDGRRPAATGAVERRFDGREWETADQFQAFFSDPALQEFIVSTGGSAGPPDLTISEAVSSPDEF